MKYFFLFLSWILFTANLQAQSQDEKLANQYFLEEKYEFALPLYEDLSEKQIDNLALYERYLDCMLELKYYDKALKLTKKRAKKIPRISQFKVDEGYVLEREGKSKEAEKTYLNIIGDLGNDYNEYPNTAAAFQRRLKFDYAIKVYEKGETTFEGLTDFSSQLAQLYMQTGNRTRGIEKYVNLVLNSGLPYEQSKMMFEMNITDSMDFIILRTVLLRNIQKMPDNYALTDLLKWTFIKQKDWNGAFIQTKALDKRLKEGGSRVIELGEMCVNNDAWDVAIKCFEYVRDLGKSGENYHAAVGGLLETRYIQVTNAVTDTIQMHLLEKDFLNYLAERGYSDYSWRSVHRLATLYTGYLHTPEKAIDLLEAFIASPGIRIKTLAAAKLELGDAYVISEDVWSSELLYAQVEMDFAEDPLGQEAKYRRARLSYFRGDFNWSKIQLDVLKGATTQLIANNAIELALKISENLGIDSNYHALELFARSELLLMQNKLEEAEITLDSIPSLYPGHTLSDDILFVRAGIREKQGRYQDAADLYETLAIAFSHDLLADNAWFQMGMLYENQLNDKDKAMKAFSKIVLDFPGSLLQPEARKHYRSLRGDNI
ncbi:MAG: tetratricopeptide repeat protein [Bacteroidetes bacterium]|nr:tetratricopeptide repeat protein [Bacteroidota bacterium]